MALCIGPACRQKIIPFQGHHAADGADGARNRHRPGRRPPMLAGEGHGCLCPAHRRNARPTASGTSSLRSAPPCPNRLPHLPRRPYRQEPWPPQEAAFPILQAREARRRRLAFAIPFRFPIAGAIPAAYVPLRLPRRTLSTSRCRISRSGPLAVAKAAALASGWASSPSAAWCPSRPS